jgi:hypothetical protein
VRPAALALVTLAGCADPVVTMSLQLPSGASSFDTSCAASVSIYALGATYKQDTTDFKQACVDLPTTASTLADVPTAVHDLVSLPIPSTGLANVIMFGNAAPCAQLPAAAQAPITADLIFYAGAAYDGNDIVLPLQPNIQCPTTQVTIMPVDMLALATTHKCSMSAIAGANAGIDIGTFSPDPIGSDAIWSGGTLGGALGSGIVNITKGRTEVADGSCVALWGGDQATDGMSCQATTAPVCAGSVDELGVISFAAAGMTVDLALVKQYGPVTFGLVYSGSADTGAPATGATVTLDDPSAGTVEYFDVPPAAVAGTAGLTKLSQASTNATGMFAVYANGMHAITVSQGGRTKTTEIAAQTSDPGTAIIRLQ